MSFKEKKFYAYLLFLVIFGFVTSFLTLYFSEKGYVIIHNNSNQVVENIELIYHNSDVDKKIWVGKLPPNSSYKHQINYANMNEFQLNINYNLSSQSKSEIVEGYVTEYYKKRYYFKIQ